LQRRGRNCWLPVMLFVGYLGYYYLAHQEEVPLTGRKQLVDLNREQETALGYQSYRQILSQSQVVPSGQAVDLVRDIGRRLAAVAEDPGFKREFSVIASDQVNAFCLPGGKVAVYTGILPVAKNADGLASMMGHEIAHAIARHGTHCSSEARTDREFRCQHGTG
jgi:predicted Zn-dependent protease